jgi:hypothetical protein
VLASGGKLGGGLALTIVAAWCTLIGGSGLGGSGLGGSGLGGSGLGGR